MKTSPILATLLVAAALAPPVGADNDPIPDNYEAIVCSFPPVSNALQSAPPTAGRCQGLDYVNPAFEAASACPDCESATLLQFGNVSVTPGVNVQAVPLPPEDVDPLGPVQTPPIDQGVATLEGGRKATDPSQYCLTIRPEGGGTPQFACVALDAFAGAVPAFGPVPIVELEGESVGPTPGYEQGEVYTTPAERVKALSFDLALSARWQQERLKQRADTSAADVWEPVNLLDPAEVQWWNANAQQVSLTAKFTLRADRQAWQTVELVVPYMGQVAGAIRATQQGLPPV